ncbi:unnamed protein product, partial [Didymodactylos carnosus]
MALLINANTLHEMGSLFEHICTVLLCPTQNPSYSLSISILSKAADQMNKDPDKQNFIFDSVTVHKNGVCESNIETSKAYNAAGGEEEDDFDDEALVTEEETVTMGNSPFKAYFQAIHEDSVMKTEQFNNEIYNIYPVNPYYSPSFLNKINELYLTTAPLWSNLTLGHLSRFGYKTSDPIVHCGCHSSRTT